MLAPTYPTYLVSYLIPPAWKVTWISSKLCVQTLTPPYLRCIDIVATASLGSLTCPGDANTARRLNSFKLEFFPRPGRIYRNRNFKNKINLELEFMNEYCGRRHVSRSTHEQNEVWLVYLAYKYSSEWINKIQNVKLNSTSYWSLSVVSDIDYIRKIRCIDYGTVYTRERKRETVYLNMLP